MDMTFSISKIRVKDSPASRPGNPSAPFGPSGPRSPTFPDGPLNEFMSPFYFIPTLYEKKVESNSLKQ